VHQGRGSTTLSSEQPNTTSSGSSDVVNADVISAKKGDPSHYNCRLDALSLDFVTTSNGIEVISAKCVSNK
jgi:hypothetical protein